MDSILHLSTNQNPSIKPNITRSELNQMIIGIFKNQKISCSSNISQQIHPSGESNYLFHLNQVN